MKLLNSALLHSQTFTKRQWQCLHKSTNFFQLKRNAGVVEAAGMRKKIKNYFLDPDGIP